MAQFKTNDAPVWVSESGESYPVTVYFYVVVDRTVSRKGSEQTPDQRSAYWCPPFRHYLIPAVLGKHSSQQICSSVKALVHSYFGEGSVGDITTRELPLDEETGSFYKDFATAKLVTVHVDGAFWKSDVYNGWASSCSAVDFLRSFRYLDSNHTVIVVSSHPDTKISTEVLKEAGNSITSSRRARAQQEEEEGSKGSQAEEDNPRAKKPSIATV